MHNFKLGRKLIANLMPYYKFLYFKILIFKVIMLVF